MSHFLLSISSVALLSLILYKLVIHPVFLSPLSKIPNAHWTSSVLPTWIWWKRRMAVESHAIHSAHQKYGPVIRLAPNELSLASLDGLRQIYTAGFEKHIWYQDEFMNYGISNMFSMLQHKPHSIQKRMIKHVYSKSYLQNSSDLCVIANVVIYERLLPLLSSAAQKNAPVEVFKLSQAIGMDFTSAYLFGITNSTNFIQDVSARQHYSKLWRSKLHRSPGTEEANKEIESIILSMCEKAEASLQTPPDEKANPAVNPTNPRPQTSNPIVYSQLSSQIAESRDHHATFKPRIFIVASEMLDHLIAGYGSTGIAFTYLLYQMSLHPATQTALRNELRTLTSPLTYPLPPNYTYSDLPAPNAFDTLPLLNAIIHETLRLHSPAPAPLKRVTPAGGVTLGGYPNIPAGVHVSASSYCLHRNEWVYPEPEAWKPERWLLLQQGDDDGDTEKGGNSSSSSSEEERRRWFWAFGSGGRMCVGNHLALYRTFVICLFSLAFSISFSFHFEEDEDKEI